MKVIKLIGFIVNFLILNDYVFAQPHFFAKYDSIQRAINIDLVNLAISKNEDSVLTYMNLYWPDSNTIKNKNIKPQEIHITNKNYANNWITYTNACMRNGDTLIYLSDMKNGDDWIIYCADFCGVYTQLIDGRTLTILINEGIDKIDTSNIKNQVFSRIAKYINMNIFHMENLELKILNKNNSRIIGYITDSNEDVSFEEIIKNKNIFWINDRYTIIDIYKIKKPYKSRGLAYGSGDMFVGSIPRNDPRQFRRFSRENNINFTKEMLREFPWAKDTFSNK